MSPQSTKRPCAAIADLDDDVDAKTTLGEAFATSIMAEIEPIPNSSGMSILRNVRNLETEQVDDIIVIRRITMPFWQDCIDKIKTPEMRYSVCAVGSPGIGKTTTTPLLIRMLLEQNFTVVYSVVTERKNGWAFEFSKKSDGSIETRVCQEKDVENLKSLKRGDCCYVVDPGTTKGNCNLPSNTIAKVIIVSSADSRNWGGADFTKRRGKNCGAFKYLPLWSLQELRDARAYLGDERITEDMVLERYREFGGVPRHIFTTEQDVNEQRQAQKRALSELTIDQARSIATSQIEFLDTMSEAKPRSAVMGYLGGDSYDTAKAVVISPLVTDKIAVRFMKDLWDTVFSQQSTGWFLFEAYTRALMANPNKQVELVGRNCVGKRDPSYNTCEDFILGGCDTIRLVHNIVTAAHTSHGVVFHSMDDQYELIDFIFKDFYGHFHAFMVAYCETHPTDSRKIMDLEASVGGAQHLTLYYLVPSKFYLQFVTKPVDPRVGDVGTVPTCPIWHVSIPDPSHEVSTA
jgi:hypothetical protein